MKNSGAWNSHCHLGTLKERSIVAAGFNKSNSISQAFQACPRSYLSFHAYGTGHKRRSSKPPVSRSCWASKPGYLGRGSSWGDARAGTSRIMASPVMEQDFRNSSVVSCVSRNCEIQPRAGAPAKLFARGGWVDSERSAKPKTGTPLHPRMAKSRRRGSPHSAHPLRAHITSTKLL